MIGKRKVEIEEEYIACDRCKRDVNKVIEESNYCYWLTTYQYKTPRPMKIMVSIGDDSRLNEKYNERFHLCAQCAQKFKEWLNG